MNMPLFTWEGRDRNGNPVKYTDLTWEDVQKMEVEERAGDEQRQSDVRLAPVVNKAVSDYAQSRGITQDTLQGGNMQPKRYATEADVAVDKTGKLKVGYSIPAEAPLNAAPPPTFTESDALSARFDEIEAGNKDAGGLFTQTGASTGQAGGGMQLVPPPQSAAQATPQGSVLGMRDDTGPIKEQPKDTLLGLMNDLPDEIVRPLIMQYNTGDIKPNELFKQIKDMKRELYDIKKADAKKKMETDEAIRQEAPGIEAEKEIAAKGNLSQEDIAAAGDDTQIKVAEIGARAQEMAARSRESIADKRNAYSERTFALKPAQLETLTTLDNNIIELEGIGNLMEDKFVGVAEGRIGQAKQFLGLLGPDEKTFRSAYHGFKNNLLKVRSGAAVTDQEFKRIANELPALTDSPVQFKAAFTKQMIALNNAKQNYLRGLAKGGVNLQGWEQDLIPGGINTYQSGLPEQTTRSSRGGGVTSTGVSVQKLEEWVRDHPDDPRAAQVRAELSKGKK